MVTVKTFKVVRTELQLTPHQYETLRDVVREENQIPYPTHKDVIDFCEALILREIEIKPTFSCIGDLKRFCKEFKYGVDSTLLELKLIELLKNYVRVEDVIKFLVEDFHYEYKDAWNYVINLRVDHV